MEFDLRLCVSSASKASKQIILILIFISSQCYFGRLEISRELTEADDDEDDDQEEDPKVEEKGKAKDIELGCNLISKVHKV